MNCFIFCQVQPRPEGMNDTNVPRIRAPDAVPRRGNQKKRNESVQDCHTSLMFEFTDPVIKRTDKKNNEKVQTLCSNNTDFGRVLVVMPSKNPDKTGVRIGTVRRKLFNHALTLDSYKDENGVALIGETSKVYINPRKNSYQMAYMGDSTEIMWGKFNNKRGAKKTHL